MIASAGGIDIAYDDVGNGIPLLLLHGFPHDRRLWQPQLGALRDRCRCVAPDLRGFGESSVTAPFSMDRYADDAAALLDVLGIERAAVGGLSMGGYIALALWRRHPKRIRALILSDTRAGADTDEGRDKRRELIALTRSRGSAAVADAQINGMIGKSTRERQPEVADTLHAMMEAAPVEGVIGALEAMMDRPDSRPTLATITVPTLVIVGDEDVLTPVAEARALQEGIRGSRLEVLAGAGHVSNLERPAAWNHVASEFLGQLAYA